MHPQPYHHHDTSHHRHLQQQQQQQLYQQQQQQHHHHIHHHQYQPQPQPQQPQQQQQQQHEQCHHQYQMQVPGGLAMGATCTGGADAAGMAPMQEDEQPQQQQAQLQQEQKPVKLLYEVVRGIPKLLERLTLLVHKTQQCEEMLKLSHQAQEEFIIQLQYRGKLHATISYQQSQVQPDLVNMERAQKDLELYESLLKEKANSLNSIRMDLLAQQHEIFEEVTLIQREVLRHHLPNWHLEQQLANNGTRQDISVSLDTIQPLVEKLTFITWRIRNQVKGLHLLITTKQNVPFNLEELDQFGVELNKSLETLILKTFVVEKQPPQVMKTNTRFTSTVRFLSGNVLNVSMINPTVRVTILSENNARAIIKRHREMIRASWMLNETPPMSQAQQLQQTDVNMMPSQVDNDLSPASSSSVMPTNQQQQQLQHTQLLTYSTLSPDQQQPPLTNMPQPKPSSAQQPQQQVIHQQQQAQQHQSQRPQQQSFFQQQQPPQQQQQFHPQRTSPTPTVSPGTYQHHVQPNFAGNLAFVEEKVLNMNEFESSGEILNSSNILEYQENTGQLVCNFRNMQLKKIKRTEKKGTESVMDEKFVLLFHCVFRICAPFDPCSMQTKCSTNSLFNQADLVYHIMAFSLPVVVIVHGNQEPHAWATVTWHNAFARSDELLYLVPDKVHWHRLGQVLSDKFRACAGKGLNSQNLEYLASKVCRNRAESCDIIVTWNQFAKEPLPEKSFTFWEWFHSIIKLTKEHLRDLWSADRIYGFIGKRGVKDLLLGSAYSEPTPVGTFLLRYSETEQGGITIAWVSGSPTKTGDRRITTIQERDSPTSTSTNVVMHLQPFGSKDLNTRSLADRIGDLDDLVYLYPDIPKEEAFRGYYTPQSATATQPNGYVKPMLIQTLVSNHSKNLNAGANSAITECANTPATPNSEFSQSSPPNGIYQDSTQFISDLDFNQGQVIYSPNSNDFNRTLQ